MSLLRNLKVFVIFLNLLTICTNGDTGSQPLDMQSLSMYNDRQMSMYPNTIYYPSSYPSYPQDRSTMMQRNSVQMEPEESKATFNDFIDAVNDLSDQDVVNSRSRAATKFAPLTGSKPMTNSYQKSHYWNGNLVGSNMYDDPSSMTPSTNLWKPKFNLLESSLKSPNKLGSLLNLGFSLLGGSGFKDTLINNILRPLLVSKRGMKSLIAKLSVPVVALVLVNVEILVVVWWLWEECPEAQPVETMTPFSSPATDGNFSTFK